MITDKQNLIPRSTSSLADVAKQAGVSTATVCRVLRRAELVRPETVNLVRTAMSEIGFVAPPPRAAKRKRFADHLDQEAQNALTRRIALITVGQTHQHWLVVTAIGSFVSSLTASARELDIDLLLDEMPDPMEMSKLVRRREVGGAVLLVNSETARSETGAKAMLALAREIPVVWAMGAHMGSLIVDRVVPDNFGVGHLAADYLTGLGCRRIVFVTDSPNWPLVRTRAFGFAAALNDSRSMQITTYVVGGDQATNVFCGNVKVVNSMAEAVAMMKSAPGGPPDGIFAPTDREIAQLHPMLVHAGLQPGRDVQLVSCDNDPAFLAMLSPRPASIDLHSSEVARHAIRRLRARMRHRNEPPVLVQVPPILIRPADAQSADLRNGFVGAEYSGPPYASPGAQRVPSAGA